MLKQFIIPVFGLAVMAVAATPAVADRGRGHWVQPAPKYTYEYEYDARPTQRAVTTTQPRRHKRKFEPNLDFETEAVWRNLRPNWFD